MNNPKLFIWEKIYIFKFRFEIWIMEMNGHNKVQSAFLEFANQERRVGQLLRR